MDRNAPLGEDLAFLWSMPARSASPVPVQGRHTVTGGSLSKGANICWGGDNVQGWAVEIFPFSLGDEKG